MEELICLCQRIFGDNLTSIHLRICPVSKRWYYAVQVKRSSDREFSFIDFTYGGYDVFVTYL